MRKHHVRASCPLVHAAHAAVLSLVQMPLLGICLFATAVALVCHPKAKSVAVNLCRCACACCVGHASTPATPRAMIHEMTGRPHEAQWSGGTSAGDSGAISVGQPGPHTKSSTRCADHQGPPGLCPHDQPTKPVAESQLRDGHPHGISLVVDPDVLHTEVV